MAHPRIDAIGLVSADLQLTVRFYRRLGCEIGEPDADSHLVIDLGGFRLMIDPEDTMRSFDPTWQASGSGRVTLAVQCAGPTDVDPPMTSWPNSVRARIWPPSTPSGGSGTPRFSTPT